MIIKYLKKIKIIKNEFNNLENYFRVNSYGNIVDFFQKHKYLNQTPLLFALDKKNKINLTEQQWIKLINHSNLNDVDIFDNNALITYYKNINFQFITNNNNCPIKNNIKTLLKNTNLSHKNKDMENPLLLIFKLSNNYNIKYNEKNFISIFGLNKNDLIFIYNNTKLNQKQKELLFSIENFKLFYESLNNK